jgi:hypothetical protein
MEAPALTPFDHSHLVQPKMISNFLDQKKERGFPQKQCTLSLVQPLEITGRDSTTRDIKRHHFHVSIPLFCIKEWSNRQKKKSR